MIERALAQALIAAGRQMPVVTLTGPRQSGKTTLARSAFPDLPYANLELPDVRARAAQALSRLSEQRSTDVLLAGIDDSLRIRD